MSAAIIAFVLAGIGCGISCPVPPEDGFELPDVTFEAIIEVRTVKSGDLVHTARGPLTWDKKTHLGGDEHRDLLFDVPDYEVNSRLISPEKVWTST